MIETIHLIHHSHTDLGYTDAPEQAMDLQVSALRRALDLATNNTVEDGARFRWTCEALGIVDEYLRRHPDEGERIARLAEAGRVEVTALPWNLTPALTRDEWTAMRHAFAPLRRRYAPRVAMQCDVNGLPWGAIPGLLDDGVRWLWFAMNAYSGGAPVRVPSAARWEGPDGRSILVWAGYGYGQAHSWFHGGEWRRGPVPEAHDIWFHEPGPTDAWVATDAGLRASYAVLTKHIETNLSSYPHSVIAVQATNQWRYDNDPPSGQLESFIAAWNAAGYSPRLEFSTPSRFIKELEHDEMFDPVAVRGDWTDWWGDGSPSMGRELTRAGRAKARLARLEVLGDMVGAAAPDTDRAWKAAFQTTEHTFGAYDSVARPWEPRAAAGWHHKSLQFSRAHELAQDCEAAVLRSAPAYVPARSADGVAVVNTSSSRGGGWVEIGLQRQQVEPRALRDDDGRVYPLEPTWQQEWSGANPKAPEVLAVPAGVWNCQPVRGRAWVTCPARSTKRLTVVTDLQPEPARAPESGEDGHWRWEWRDGVLHSLARLDGGAELIDAAAPHAFAGLLWEHYETDRAWDRLASRDAALRDARRVSEPRPESWTSVPSAYGAHWRWRRQLDAWRACEQSLRLLPDGAVEITTKVWVREHLSPVGLWLALPLGPQDAEPVYDSLGHPTRVGADQLPDSCGEFVGGLTTVGYTSNGFALTVDCTDTPIVAPGGIHTRTGRLAARPDRPHWYPCLLATWWATNFPHCRPTALQTRHVLRVVDEWAPADEAPLVAFPSRAPYGS